MMSGLKINYHKSEVIAFGVSSEEQNRIANMLNCKVGSLPMTYMGLPISDSNLGVHSFEGIVEKMRKKLQAWKGKNLSSGGKTGPYQFLPEQPPNIYDGDVLAI